MPLLQMSSDQRHFNSLIWQVPSWGIAIAAGVVIAAREAGQKPSVWRFPAKYAQTAVLAFGFFLLAALTIALYKCRVFQAATMPENLPKPPVNVPPSANRYLQGAMCLTTGCVAGLAGAQLMAYEGYIAWGGVVGLVAWVVLEILNKKVVKQIDSQRTAARDL